jgi:hypothetical protein
VRKRHGDCLVCARSAGRVMNPFGADRSCQRCRQRSACGVVPVALPVAAMRSQTE